MNGFGYEGRCEMLEDLIFNRLMTPFWTAWHSQVLGLDLRCSVDWPGLGSYKLAAGEDGSYMHLHEDFC